MSLPIKLPISARPTLTANIFTATWNAPTVGKYDFTNVAANQNQTVYTLTGSSIYIIERACFGTTLSEANFQESIDSTIGLPSLIFKTLKTGQQIFPRPLPFVNYLDNLELLLFIPSDQKDDQIVVSFEAVLDQIPDTVGIDTIRAFVQLNIYEVDNTAWVRRFYHDQGHGRTGVVLPRNTEGTFG